MPVSKLPLGGYGVGSCVGNYEETNTGTAVSVRTL
jgi:hypothetical protein